MRARRYRFTYVDVLDKWAGVHPVVLQWLSHIPGRKYWNLHAVALLRFCDWAQIEPERLLALKDDINCLDAERLVDRFVSTADMPASVKAVSVKSVRSFFMWHYKDLRRKAGSFDYMPTRESRFIGKTDRKKLFESCFNRRDRALFIVAFTSGLALESLGSLCLSHFEPEWMKQDYPHLSLPPELVKGHGLGKYRSVRQETFITPEAKKCLIDYFDWMAKKHGVVFTPSAKVFWTINKPIAPMPYDSIGTFFFDLGTRAGMPVSAHDGRRVLETALESVGCPRNWVQKMKGRKVRGEDAPYSKPAIEQLRGWYEKAAEELRFVSESLEELMGMSKADLGVVKMLVDKYKEGKVKIEP